jgi:hypothetical protein
MTLSASKLSRCGGLPLCCDGHYQLGAANNCMCLFWLLRMTGKLSAAYKLNCLVVGVAVAFGPFTYAFALCSTVHTVNLQKTAGGLLNRQLPTRRLKSVSALVAAAADWYTDGGGQRAAAGDVWALQAHGRTASTGPMPEMTKRALTEWQCSPNAVVFSSY